jgi:thioredoxin-related protein
MKLIFFVATLIFCTSADWLTNFDEALQEAKTSNKKILLNFSGSDWCAPCILMKRNVFEQEAFQEYASENLVLLRADFPRNKKNQLEAALKAHNEKLADKYNPQGKFPLTLLLDAEGNVLHTWDGYNNQPAAEFLKEVNQIVHGK